MNLKTVAAVGAAFGILGVGSAFATFARIESMGKNTTYIMDDVSIFDNPANINLYSNYLIGEFGPYTQDVDKFVKHYFVICTICTFNMCNQNR